MVETGGRGELVKREGNGDRGHAHDELAVRGETGNRLLQGDIQIGIGTCVAPVAVYVERVAHHFIVLAHTSVHPRLYG